MDWLNRILGGGARGGADNALYLYVQCGRCGTPVAVRINLGNDLSRDYEAGGLVLVKEIMDSKCFQLMRAQVHFDDKYKIRQREIEGGKFITQAEYEQLKPTSDHGAKQGH